ncbi:hypothetical protein HS088_TW04G01622 [Tripterygium wilfordii]|uniref:J domain-containing protein n=1 Tax=Tripterygium wilfordii TaxID=458696 RepID=A0A7J7DTG2_TRIWF|nr:chaperone protein dnaJ 72 [Tripterygium wilfordii]KAF5749650.1 hypothetical protein HS088_TW04G01622 [Tripterygium wilfordii]
MDHYKELGLERNASKKEIKEAFRRLALEFHPDKHSQSSKAVRDAAAIKFKQLSEAYQFLIDDSKRSYYDRVQSQSTASTSSTYGYGYYDNNYNHRQTYRHATSEGLLYKLGIALRLITPRAFLLNAIFAGALFGGIFMVDASGKALWQMRNSGKSFEEAMESIEKAKAHKDKT